MIEPMYFSREVSSVQWTGNPVLELLPNGKDYMVNENFDFTVHFKTGMEVKVRINSGFKFDGASIPKLARSLIGGSMDGKYRIPAMLHDALYAGRVFDRYTCDKTMLHAMKRAGESAWKRTLIWIGLKIGGGVSYEKCALCIARNRKNYVLPSMVMRIPAKI